MYLDRDDVFAAIPTTTLAELVQLGCVQLQKDSKLSYMKRVCDLVVKVLMRQEKYDEMMQWVLSYEAVGVNK
jgi:hypothetical protein